MEVSLSSDRYSLFVGQLLKYLPGDKIEVIMGIETSFKTDPNAEPFPTTIIDAERLGHIGVFTNPLNVDFTFSAIRDCKPLPCLVIARLEDAPVLFAGFEPDLEELIKLVETRNLFSSKHPALYYVVGDAEGIRNWVRKLRVIGETPRTAIIDHHQFGRTGDWRYDWFRERLREP